MKKIELYDILETLDSYCDTLELKLDSHVLREVYLEIESLRNFIRVKKRDALLVTPRPKKKINPLLEFEAGKGWKYGKKASKKVKK